LKPPPTARGRLHVSRTAGIDPLETACLRAPEPFAEIEIGKAVAYEVPTEIAATAPETEVDAVKSAPPSPEPAAAVAEEEEVEDEFDDEDDDDEDDDDEDDDDEDDEDGDEDGDEEEAALTIKNQINFSHGTEIHSRILLFSAQKPMSVKELRDLLANAATAEDADEAAKPFKKTKDDDVTAALEELAREHAAAARSYRLRASRVRAVRHAAGICAVA